jgi:23S rRNA pseudouridine1911/1915/1917 synthase
LARDVPAEASLSRTRLARLLEAGAVTRDGRALGPRDAVREGDVLEVALPEPEPTHIAGEAIPLDVAHEDEHLIVVDKPAGMVVHPAPGSPSGTLVNALVHRLGGELPGEAVRPGIVHRLDKDTSGLLVAAKTERAHHGLAAQFEAHDVDRLYLAVCHGIPGAGDPRLMGLRGVSSEGGWLRIATGLGRHRTDRQRQAVVEGGRHAVTRFRVMRAFAAAALVECRLETGRTHQIRVHLCHAGHGLVGDPVYGGRRRMPAAAPGAAEAATFPRQALHAARLGFVHPATGQAMAFESEPPADMAALIAALGR